jgi:hypothetical protein
MKNFEKRKKASFFSDSANHIGRTSFRFLSIILVMTMLLSVAAGCDKSGSDETVGATTIAASGEIAETTKATTAKPTKAPTPVPTETEDLPGVLPYEPIVTDIFTADPSAHVFDGKLYIYGSHDRNEIFASDNDGGGYMMNDYHVLSMDGFDTDTTDHGVAFSVEDVPWADKQLWAPDCAFKDGTYYFYFPAKDVEGIFRIGVATGDKPEGPFTPEENFIEGSYSIDPSVFTDDDGKSYMIFGGIWGGQLERWQTGEYDITAGTPGGDNPALGPMMAEMSGDMLSFDQPAAEIQILDENGQPIKASDESRRFFEGAWIHKYNDTYYLSYSTGTTHYLVYATSDTPLGPYTYQGKILEPVKGWTTHHSIVEYEGQWYLFYHDAKMSGKDSQRTIKYAELFYNDDGTIQEVVIPK